MLEMIYENDINNAKVAWNAFIESVKSDVKSLKARQSEISEMEKNAEGPSFPAGICKHAAGLLF